MSDEDQNRRQAPGGEASDSEGLVIERNSLATPRMLARSQWLKENTCQGCGDSPDCLYPYCDCVT